jgi:hypothetical protein
MISFTASELDAVQRTSAILRAQRSSGIDHFQSPVEFLLNYSSWVRVIES